MVLLADGIGKAGCAANLRVLLRDATEKPEVSYIRRVAVRPRTADSKLENGLDLATGDAQVFKTGAEECHRGNVASQRMLRRNLGKD
jgi:hypothetical protein